MTSYEEIVGRRMASSPTCNWCVVGRDLDPEKVYSWAIYYLVKDALERARVELKYSVDDCKPIKEFSQYFGKGLKDYRGKMLFYYLDKILEKNGYPKISDILKLAYKLWKEKQRDFSISVDDFARMLGVASEMLVIPLAILLNNGIYGVHISTAHIPKYYLPPRNIGFDSLFIHGISILNTIEKYQDVIEMLNKKDKKKVRLVPSNLLETGRRGYIVEYEGKVVYTAYDRKELLKWLKKHGKPEMFVFKIDNCWVVEIE